MFTGIVAELGTIESIETGAGGARMTIKSSFASDLDVGGSIAVNGACLTAVHIDGSLLDVDAMAETLARTSLGDLRQGDPVNLERPVGPSGLFEGHIVQGHVDGIATIRSVQPEGDARRVWLDLSQDLLRYVVEKGSIALDGVSLTVTATDATGFEVALIPHTIQVTNLGHKGVGDGVNVEVDVIAKYVERLVT